MHAVFHVIVENQLADSSLAIVRETLLRLQSEGVNRHDAIHAIGSVLANHIHGTLVGGTAAESDNEKYFAELKELTRESWYRSFDSEDDE